MHVVERRPVASLVPLVAGELQVLQLRLVEPGAGQLGAERQIVVPADDDRRRARDLARGAEVVDVVVVGADTARRAGVRLAGVSAISLKSPRPIT
jgi:hypothetical protein